MENLSEINDDLKYIFKSNNKIWKNLQNKNIFITGGTGPFGFWILKSFIYANNYLGLKSKIFLLSRKKNNKFTKLISDKNISYIKGDIRNFKFFKKNIDIIIHGATTSAHETFKRQDPNEKISVLVEGTKRILNFAKFSNCKKILFISSGVVYGNRDKKIKFSENMSIAPLTNDLNFDISALGEAKRLAELMTIIFSKKNKCKVNIARCFSFIGPLMPLNLHYAVGNFLRDAIKSKQINIKGNPNTLRSYLYFADLAAIIWKIVLSNNNRQIYNVGSDKALSMLSIAKKIKKLLPHTKIIFKKNNKYKKSFYIPSIKKIKKNFNFEPKYSFLESLKKTHSSIIKNKKLYDIR